VLDKAVAILRAVAEEPATLAELVARTGLPRATAHRLAVALEGHRLVRRSPEGTWVPGPSLAELARGGPDLADLAGRHLVVLRDASGESSQFYVRDGATRVCLAAAERTSGLRDTVPVGARLPMTAGSAAHALLAFAPADEVTRLLPNASFTARTLLDVRRRGWAHSIAEREPGVASLSAPVRDGNGAVLGAVSVSGPVERLGRRPSPEIVGAVLDAAAAISRAAR
jgi:DNA-binding IclR family transcriptional regulator